MPEQRKFEPKWPDSPNGPNDLYYPDDLEDRTPHPEVVPQEVLNIIASTYAPIAIVDNKDLKFTLFPKLPIELRRMVWRHSLPGPRVVEVMYDSRDGACSSPCSIPATLHVNSEARRVALQSYEVCFATISGAVARIYFDMEVDILFLGTGNFHPSGDDPAAALFRQLLPTDLKRIRNIAIDIEIDTLFQDDDMVEPGLMNMGLESLESVTIINNDKGQGHHDMVLQRSTRDSGEFHAWSLDELGKALPWPVPKEVTPWEGDVLCLWSNLEIQIWNENYPTQTLRVVCWDTLERDPAWIDRIGRRRGHVYEWLQGCLYEEDGVIERLVELISKVENHPKYHELTDILSAGHLRMLMPLTVYEAQHHCCCPIGHRQLFTPDSWYPDISKLDLKAAIAVLGDKESS